MSATRMDRIRRVSRVMKYGCGAAIALSFVGVAAALAIFALRDPLPAPGDAVIAAPSLLDRTVAIALLAIPVAFALAVLSLSARLFAAFERGRVLVPQNGRLLSAIGANVIAATIAKGVSTSLLGAYFSWRAGDGKLEIAVSSGEISGIGAGLLLVVVGWVIGEAAELAREHAAIV